MQEIRLQEALDEFRDGVRRRRERLGLSQGQAAIRAGISQSHWSKIERGLVDPSVTQALRIQIALEAPSIELFFGDFPATALIRDESDL